MKIVFLFQSLSNLLSLNNISVNYLSLCALSSTIATLFFWMNLMALTLHGAPLSPFVRKVMYLLALSKTDYKLKVIVPGSVPDDFVTISPLRRIPVLQDNEFYQADSSIVCNYLIETLNHDNLKLLIPTNAQLRAHMRWLEKFADYELVPWLSFVVFRQRVLIKAAGKTPNEERIQEALSVRTPPLLDYLTN